MEPRPNRRGNPKDAVGGGAGDTLQWSHVLTDVETYKSFEVDEDSKAASMEPRPNRRGNMAN